MKAFARVLFVILVLCAALPATATPKARHRTIPPAAWCDDLKAVIASGPAFADVRGPLVNDDSANGIKTYAAARSLPGMIDCIVMESTFAPPAYGCTLAIQLDACDKAYQSFDLAAAQASMCLGQGWDPEEIGAPVRAALHAARLTRPDGIYVQTTLLNISSKQACAADIEVSVDQDRAKKGQNKR